MPVFMLDTNAINFIGYREPFFEILISMVKKGKITLFVTHIQQEEIIAISDLNAEVRSKLQNFTKKYCKQVPTNGIILGVSRLGCACFSNGEDFNAISKENPRMTHDALIASTAKINADYFVTDDITLRKKIINEFPRLNLLTNEEFHQMVSSYSS